jgi:hypothetical protein
MDINTAWINTLEQLQTNLPKTQFDTWVRDTEIISFVDGVVTVGARNAYTQDWLSSRLTNDIEQLLGVALGQPIHVRFGITDQVATVEDEIDETSTGDPRFAVELVGEKDIRLDLEDYDSLYEQVVHPDRAVYLPGYFRRWLCHLGPVRAWIYVAFRQSAYMTGVRQGYGSGRFSGRQIAALAGISERTFWNRADSPETWKQLAGLVKIADHGPQWDERSSTPKRLARRYTVAMTLPMTPTDVASLARWIQQHIDLYGGPEGVLRAAAEASLEELIPLDTAEISDAVTVRKLVHSLFGGGELSDGLLDALASDLQNHIMPSNDQIKITLYFLEHVLPYLGAGPAWMLTILRDLCYADPETGEMRNRVVVQGGYAEIAGWMGMARPLTIYEWMHPISKGKGKEILSVYVREISNAERKLDFASQPRAYEALLDEIPREILEIAATPPDYVNFSMAITQLAEDIYANFSIGFTRFAKVSCADFSTMFTQFAEDIYATCRVKTLNSLNQALNTLKPPPTNTDNHVIKTASGGRAVVNMPSAWVLDRLLNVNRVTAKKAKALRALNASGVACVSWLLYAKGKDGAGITSPVSYAISRLEIDPVGGAGGGYDWLASLPPQKLLGMIYDFAKGQSILDLRDDGQSGHLWRELMGSDQNIAIGMLRLLMGEDAPFSREVVSQTETWSNTGAGVATEIQTSIKKL